MRLFLRIFVRVFFTLVCLLGFGVMLPMWLQGRFGTSLVSMLLISLSISLAITSGVFALVVDNL